MRASALARADGRSDTAPNAIASVSLVRAPSDDASTDAAVVRRFAAECVPANRDDATRADETRVGSKRAPSLLPHPLSRTARDFPRDTLPPIFAFDGATSACEVRLVLDPPETELAPPDDPKITKPRGAPRLSPRLPRLRPNPDANPPAPSPRATPFATAERAARRVRRRRNRRATDDPRVDALVARVNAAIAAARRSAPIPRCPDASSIDRLDRRPRDPNDSVDRDREDRDRRDREDRNRNRRDRDRDRDPNPPLAWIRRLVAFAESSPVFEPPAPGEPPPVYDRAAGAWIRALFPSTRDAVATRADVRLLERWLEQTVEGILDDDRMVDDDAKDTIGDDESARGTHRNTSARSVDTDSSAKERVSSSNPLSFATVATLCDGALWAHRAAFDALLRRVSSECRDRGRLLSRVWTRTVALVDARARADAESRWVAERARRRAAEEDAANARAALAETRDELRAEMKRRRDETDALTASLSAASRRAEKIAASLRDAGRAESIAKASAESSAAAAAKARASPRNRRATSPSPPRTRLDATPRTRGRRSRRRASSVRGRRWKPRKPRLESPRRARRRFASRGNFGGKSRAASSPRRRRRPSSRKRPPRSSTPRPARASRNTTPRSRTDARRRRRRERRRRRRTRRTRPRRRRRNGSKKTKRRRRSSPRETRATREMPPRRARPPPRRAPTPRNATWRRFASGRGGESRTPSPRESPPRRTPPRRRNTPRTRVELATTRDTPPTTPTTKCDAPPNASPSSKRRRWPRRLRRVPAPTIRRTHRRGGEHTLERRVVGSSPPLSLARLSLISRLIPRTRRACSRARRG